MSEHDRGMAIAMLAEGFNVKVENLTPARIHILTRAFEKVPVAVLKPMVERAIDTRKPRWGDLPAVAELLEDAETCRRELLAQFAFSPCVQCEHSPGWVGITDDKDAPVKRCRCWEIHQQKVQALGVGHAPLALPAGREEIEV